MLSSIWNHKTTFLAPNQNTLVVVLQALIVKMNCLKQVALSELICRFSPFALWDLANFG